MDKTNYYKFSFFISFKNVGILTDEEIFLGIKSGRWKKPVDKYRNALLIDDNAYKLKNQLPAFAISGVFKGSHTAENLVQYSKIIGLDFDKVDDLERLKKKVIELEYTYAAFISPSENGLKVFVKVNSNENQHSNAYKLVRTYYENIVNTKSDDSCKNINRLCYFSYDKDLYYNPDSKIFEIALNKKSKQITDNNLIFNDGTSTDNHLQKIKILKESLDKKMTFQEGNRNHYIATLAGIFNRYAIPNDTALNYLLRFTESNFSENEIRQTFSSIYRKTEWNGTANVEHDFTETLLSASNHLDSIKDFIMPNTKSTSVILETLLSTIEPIDFREYANLFDEKLKLQKKHYLVSVVEILIDKSKEHEFDLCRKNGEIFLYNSQYWASIGEDVFKDFLGEVALKMGVQKFDAKLHSFKDELYKQFLTDAGLEEIKPNTDTTLINLKNGTFEISPNNQTIREFRQSDFITYQLPFEYDKSANAPKFKAFLNQVLPDAALQDILSEYLGYVFIKSSILKLEKVLLLYGSGANGKSVMFDIINAILGVENTTSYTLQSLTDENGYSRAMIANKLLNYASEINGRLEASIFKQLASGEPVSARLPYGKPHIINDYAKLMFNCNELPRTVENTNAFFRRFIIIPFKVTIPEDEQDKGLSKKIINTELSGVFNWILEGLQRLLKNRVFTDSKLIKEEITQFRKESDSVLMFLEEYKYVKSITKRMDRTTIYHLYKEYCLDFGNRPLSAGKFYKRLRSKDFKEESSNGIRYFNIEAKKEK